MEFTSCVKFLSLAGCFVLAGQVRAASGTFGTDIGLTSDLFSGGQTFFEADLLGDNRHAPIATSTVTLPVTLNTTGFNLGTFTLTLIGGELLTFKNNGSNVSAATLEYKVDSGAFTAFNLNFNQDSVNGSTGDQRWASTSGNIDLLAGLTPGAHTVSFYTFATTTDGNAFDSNNANNFTANFTVQAVPEPCTWVVSLLVSLAVGGFILRRKLVA